MRTFEEGEEHAGRATRRRVVEHDLGRPAVARRLAGEAVVPPERAVVGGVALDDGAGGDPLGELVARRWERGLVDDPRGERGRDGDDDVTRSDQLAVGEHGDRVVGLGDAPDRAGQAHAVAEVGREPERHELRAAHEAVLLRAVGRVPASTSTPPPECV